jgi:prevent-host-death family protein
VTTVNMLEAKSNLSKLVEAVESGAEKEVIIARNGRPAAKLVPITQADKPPLLGIAKGLFEVPDNIDALNDEIAKMFYDDDA